jgi:hypothetical protein
MESQSNFFCHTCDLKFKALLTDDTTCPQCKDFFIEELPQEEKKEEAVQNSDEEFHDCLDEPSSTTT